MIGSFELNKVYQGDCLEMIPRLPDESVDIVITSPPYWGLRDSKGAGIEEDPRDYLKFLSNVFSEVLPKLKHNGILWINLGDTYNTPINWQPDSHSFSTLGPEKNGLPAHNSAYSKPRIRRKAFLREETPWLQYGNLLAIPYRLITALCDKGYIFRGEIIWRKLNPMPEGRCRRPHRCHEPIYLLAKNETHNFRVSPPVKSVWEFSNEKVKGLKHFSRFPELLPSHCIEAYGTTGDDVIVLDPFSGSGTTGVAALRLGCSYIGFEIDLKQVTASNQRLQEAKIKAQVLF